MSHNSLSNSTWLYMSIEDFAQDLHEISGLHYVIIQTFVKQSSRNPSIHRVFFSNKIDSVYYIG